MEDNFKRKLFILRHAKAEIGHGLSDFDRPLAEKGKQQSMQLGAHLKLQETVPEIIYSSPAKRTLRTAEFVRANMTHAPHEIPLKEVKSIYNAFQSDLFHFIQSLEDDLTSVMIVGHNPGIHGVADMLAQMDDAEDRFTLKTQYKPSTLTILGTDTESWKDIQPESFKLLAYTHLKVFTE